MLIKHLREQCMLPPPSVSHLDANRRSNLLITGCLFAMLAHDQIFCRIGSMVVKGLLYWKVIPFLSFAWVTSEGKIPSRTFFLFATPKTKLGHYNSLPFVFSFTSLVPSTLRVDVLMIIALIKLPKICDHEGPTSYIITQLLHISQRKQHDLSAPDSRCTHRSAQSLYITDKWRYTTAKYVGKCIFYALLQLSIYALHSRGIIWGVCTTISLVTYQRISNSIFSHVYKINSRNVIFTFPGRTSPGPASTPGHGECCK